MTGKSQKIRFRSLSWAILLTTFLTLTSVCYCDDWLGRQNSGELLLIVNPVSVSQTTSSKYNADLKIEDTTFYAFGLGVNLNDHFNLNFDASFFTNFDFKLSQNDVLVNHSDVDSMSMNLNLDYNILKERITPLVSAGVGFIRFDGSWDNTLFGSFSETDLTYNLGAGLRWDITDNIGFKAIYRNMWALIKDADDPARFDGISFSLMIRFK
jgi:opacity protein-like surface antigen